MPNLTFNYVVKALNRENQPVVLKVSCAPDMFTNEIKTLQHFNGHGVIKLIETHAGKHAMLLAQASPGDTLKSHYLNDVSITMQLASIPLPSKYSFSSMREWLTAIDRP